MKVVKYGITLSLIREEDIEMVRRWRNDPVVANNFEYREHITPEMQKTWFRSVYNSKNLYLIIEHQGRKMGVINLKDIDWENKSYDGGVFLPDPKDHNTPVPAAVTFMTVEIIFRVFGWPVGYAHVLKGNKPIQSFVKQLGYELCAGQGEVNNQKYYITEERFEKNAAKIGKAISVLFDDHGRGRFIVEQSEFEDEVVLFWQEAFLKFRPGSVPEVTGEGRIYYYD